VIAGSRDPSAHGQHKVDPELVQIVYGRTPLGLAFAHVCVGSTVTCTFRGVRRDAVTRRAGRCAKRLTG
jgi:hypothetical protein